jgi:hypothetical protein
MTIKTVDMWEMIVPVSDTEAWRRASVMICDLAGGFTELPGAYWGHWKDPSGEVIYEESRLIMVACELPVMKRVAEATRIILDQYSIGYRSVPGQFHRTIWDQGKE